ncbi:helix-turn-helix domain-containing protein [Croceicoccus estronivorus]|uniref:helix-turn-helix domain-containing protein n=1 Tax=Croceicoccus estronivorus TaxID=1172626 RepID=UPI00147861C4|nr:AraC family transcriptional regulator [Croceicoccus estronivorus]
MIDLRMNAEAKGDPRPKPWTVLAELTIPEARIELRRYELPSPNEMLELDEAPIFSLTMPRAGGMRGAVAFDGGERRGHKVGRMMFRPAGVAMRSVGDGGVLDIMTCRMAPDSFQAATGLDDWDPVRLRRCAMITSSTMFALAERLRGEIVTPGFGSEMAAESLVRLLMVDIGRQLRMPARRPGARGGLAPWQLARIEDALRTCAGEWPTTAELAALCGISRSHLSRSFMEATGKPLADHAAAVRLERAQDMMRAGTMAMNEIARTLGFATPSAFTVAFRRMTGRTPRQFARLLS